MSQFLLQVLGFSITVVNSNGSQELRILGTNEACSNETCQFYVKRKLVKTHKTFPFDKRLKRKLQMCYLEIYLQNQA